MKIDNAMQEYRYLMRLAHVLNALVLATQGMSEWVREHGEVQTFLRTFRTRQLWIATKSIMFIPCTPW